MWWPFGKFFRRQQNEIEEIAQETARKTIDKFLEPDGEGDYMILRTIVETLEKELVDPNRQFKPGAREHLISLIDKGRKNLVNHPFVNRDKFLKASGYEA